jgi:DNA-directed RNA polymerase subunit RPC12/RpoP
MIAEFLGAAQSVQALASLLKSAQGLANYNEIVAAVSEVNAKLMSAQAVGLQALESQSTLHARVKELEAQLQALNDWQQVAPDYALQAVGAFKRDFVRVYKPRGQGLEPRHWACARCFEEKKRYVLTQTQNERAYQCPNCGATVSPIIPGGTLAPIESAYEALPSSGVA